MPDNTSLVINAIDANNKKVSNNITYVNPSISNNTAIELAQRISALSSDSYQSTTRIDKTECDRIKPQRTITKMRVGGTDMTLDSGTYKGNIAVSSMTSLTFSVTITESSLATFGVASYPTNITMPDGWSIISNRLEYASSQNAYYIRPANPTAGDVMTFTIVIPEDDTYAETSAPIEVTIVADT